MRTSLRVCLTVIVAITLCTGTVFCEETGYYLKKLYESEYAKKWDDYLHYRRIVDALQREKYYREMENRRRLEQQRYESELEYQRREERLREEEYLARRRRELEERERRYREQIEYERRHYR